MVVVARLRVVAGLHARTARCDAIASAGSQHSSALLHARFLLCSWGSPGAVEATTAHVHLLLCSWRELPLGRTYPTVKWKCMAWGTESARQCKMSLTPRVIRLTLQHWCLLMLRFAV